MYFVEYVLFQNMYFEEYAFLLECALCRMCCNTCHLRATSSDSVTYVTYMSRVIYMSHICQGTFEMEEEHACNCTAQNKRVKSSIKK